MLGHLKAEEFINMLEGAELSERKQAHFARCERCRKTLSSANAMHAKVTQLAMEADENLPEPDWSDFRASVRDHLLSRSIQREATQRGWSNWTWKPAMVWSMSAMFVLGLTTGLFVWNKSGASEEDLPFSAAIVEPLLEADNVSIETWAAPDAFEELARLGADEAAVLGDLLQGASETSSTP